MRKFKHGRAIVAGILLMVLPFSLSKGGKRLALASEGVSLELNEQAENLSDSFWENLQEANTITGRFFGRLNEVYGITFNSAIYTVNGIRAEDYPDFFAGFYINTNGQLIVQIADDCFPEEYRQCDWYQSFVDIVNCEDFYCHQVRYSYSELIDAISDITYGNKSVEFSDAGISIISAGINDYRNVIDVRVGSQADYEYVSGSLDSDIYSVSVVELEPQYYVGLYAGEGATTSNSSSYQFSVACRVRRNFPGGTYTYGFLTCAHAFTGTSNVYIVTGPFGNTLVGTSNSSLQVKGGSVDVAFIETNATTTLYNTVYLQTITLNSGYSTSMGSPVYKRGESTGLTYGSVTNSSATITLNGVTYSDIVITGAYAAPGDSGGIVFTKPDTSNRASAIGIVLGGAVTESYFTKMSNDIAALQSGPITFTVY